MLLSSLRSLICDQDWDRVLVENWRNTSALSIPHVTECSQHVDLSWLPAIFLILFCPLTLYDLYRSENPRARRHSPVTYRILICVILVIDLSCSFFHNAYNYFILEKSSTLHYLAGDCAQYIGLCLALTLLIACRNRGIVTSGVLFNYWLLMVLCGFPELRYLLEHHFTNREEDSFHFFLYMIYYPLICLELILSCFADTPSGAFIGKQVCPELSTSFLNQITFNWFTGLAVKGYKKPLERDDLWGLNERDASVTLIPQFNKYFKPELKRCQDRRKQKHGSCSSKCQPSVLLPLFKTYKLLLIYGALLRLLADLLTFVAPILLKQLIGFIQDLHQPLWVGVATASVMFFVAELQSVILSQYIHLMFRLGMNIRSVLSSAVYFKAMNLSNNARKHRTTGEIVNLMSVDIQKLQDITTNVMMFWSAPLQVVLSAIFLWKILGVAVISGLVLLIVIVPFNSYITGKMKNCQARQMSHKDERMKMMSELLNGIKLLKLYAWERCMQNTVLIIRQKELNVLKKLAFFNAGYNLLWSCLPFLVAVLSFAVFVVIDPNKNVLTPQVTFVALTLFNILRLPLSVFPIIYSQAVQCRVSNRRLKSFFAEEEISSGAVSNKSSEEALRIENGTFAWEKEQGNETLKNINLSVRRGQLIAVVGKVGTGKSSLLQAILGEMNKVSGFVNVSGAIAYVPQKAWIQNLTLRDNILFGHTYDCLFYDKVVDACALRQDLSSLPAEDFTEVGERGINLSGGQKQRVSLARAIYSRPDIVLLDDPLSAVDSHVGKHIFKHVISSKSGLLSNATRILVTHELHYLKYCDKVIVLRNGEISEMGPYQELIAKQGAFSDFLEQFLVEKTEKRGRGERSVKAEDVSELMEEMMKLSPERRSRIESQSSQEAGHEKGSVSKLSPPSPTTNGSAVGADYIEEERNILDAKTGEKIALLIKEKKQVQMSKLIEKEGMEIGKVKWAVYITYMRAIGFAVVLIFIATHILGGILGVASNLWLAKWTDDELIQKTSNGTSNMKKSLAIYASLGVGQALLMCAAPTIMALGMVGASRLLHEGILRNVLHLPMQFFDTTPIGRILNRFGKDVDTLDTRLPLAVTLFVGTVTQTITIVTLPIYTTPAVVILIIPALVFYLFILITRTLNLAVRIASDLETNIVAVERIKEYTDSPVEGAQSKQKPVDSWPKYGKIVLKDVCMRYRAGLDLVLKHVSASIEPREKIGIVGRTGAGKSSLAMALFRTVEIDSGSIEIDGYSISTLGLEDLRSRLTIVPQDPVLFSGTLRFNLDPFDAYNDEEIWHALRNAHLETFVASLAGNLLYHISEGGQNLSAGQRQLLCLARALLRRSKILVLDEAAAAVDAETDSLLQQTIREQFADSTVLTIAHRLNTVMDYDRLLVMDAGRAVEFDSPSKLLAKRDGLFRSMAEDAGIVRQNKHR
ncbi:unnamed protein product [Cylicocyclus nassatus]|uniref:ABC-type glutathione-S-conjugate transporter n=1 Tax=Cylicocyclus nassatus TaxID=53992 RepID=A0AA36HGB3_CYLNA|nr:unnamed protein product [Cylicocyclus nassatus]